MADKNTLVQMLENLVNDDQAKAEELFHEYVVAKSREIYEGLIEAEMTDDEDEEDKKKVDEEMDDEDDEDKKKVDEEFEDIAIEGDDEIGGPKGDMGDDLEADLDAEMDSEMDDDGDEGEKSEEELFMDLESIVDELQAKFDELKGDDGNMDMGDEDGEMKDDFDLATVREYVEKVAPAKMGDNGANTKSIVAGKNDMGGTTANIARGDTANDGEVGAGSKIKGSALNDQNPKEDNAGNINVPGGKAGNAFSKKEPGHGAEKKGAGESADNKQSLFRGRR